MTDGITITKKVAVVSDGLPPTSNGGIATSHGNLMAALVTAGLECRGFTFAEQSGPSESQQIKRFGFSDNFYKISRLLFTLCLRILRRIGIFARDRGIAEEAVVAVLGSIAGLRLVLPILRFAPDWIIVPDRGAVSAWWPTSLKKKLVFVSHSNPMRFVDRPLIGERSLIDATLAIWLEKRALKGSKSVVCPSKYMAQCFAATYEFNGPVEVVPNCMDTDLIGSTAAAREFVDAGLIDGTPVVYIPAADNQNKGRQFVFELIRRIATEYRQPIAFYLSGPLTPELTASLQFAPANAKIFSPGSVSYKRNLSLIRACTVCLSPTLIENFGMALLEAQALGLPVVTFQVGGNSEVIENGHTGFVVPYLNIENLIEQTLALLRQKSLHTEMSVAAMTRAQNLFSGEAIAQKYVSKVLIAGPKES